MSDLWQNMSERSKSTQSRSENLELTFIAAYTESGLGVFWWCTLTDFRPHTEKKQSHKWRKIRYSETPKIFPLLLKKSAWSTQSSQREQSFLVSGCFWNKMQHKTYCTFVQHLSALHYSLQTTEKRCFQIAVIFFFIFRLVLSRPLNHHKIPLSFPTVFKTNVKEKALSYLQVLILLLKRCWVHQLSKNLIGISTLWNHSCTSICIWKENLEIFHLSWNHIKASATFKTTIGRIMIKRKKNDMKDKSVPKG